MRDFSLSEKSYIIFIIDSFRSNDWRKIVIKNLIYAKFNRSIDIGLFPGFEVFDGESNDRENTIGYNNAVINGYIPIAEFLNLLYTLEKYSLVSIIPYFDSDDFDIDVVGEPNAIVQNAVPKQYFSISDHSYLKFLRRNYSYLVYPSQELIDLVDNKFMTKDEKRYKNQKTITLFSISVAILIGLLGFFKPNSPVRINDNQIDRTLIDIRQGNKELRDIRQLVDSINTKVKKPAMLKSKTSKKR